MSTRQRWILIGGLVVAAVLVGVSVVFRVGLKRRAQGVAPADWLDPGQPAEGVAAQLGVISPAESLAAGGCPSFFQCSPSNSARVETMRTYPGHLTEHSGSLIHGLDAGIRVEIGN